MWKIREKLETIKSDARNTIAERKTDVILKREAAKRRLLNMRLSLRERFVQSLDKAFVGVVQNMEKAINRLSRYFNRGVKVECAIDKDQSTALRDWVQ